MRITVVTNENGKIVASILGHVSKHLKHPGPHATLRKGPGQIFHEIEVPDHYEDLAPAELHSALKAHVNSPPEPCG